MFYRLILTYQERSNKKSIHLHKFGFTRKEWKRKENRMSLHIHKDELKVG